ncbi:MAG: hypothetical protein H6Q67_1062 [Firmicutes bacterium]|nr:hypothetical protein [Bacillota bacterium]
MRRSRIGGWVLILVGLVFLLEKMGIITWSVMSYLWPFILIGIGALLVVKPH